MSNKERVCVTGAGGYVASWLVKLLLSKGYIVHGTVRNPYDDKNAHLKNLENSTECLKLFKADLLDYQGLCSAITGCTGVFHVATAFPPRDIVVLNPEVELMEPAVTGTLNVLNACLTAEVKKVVVVSSIGAIVFNPFWPKDQVMDEQSWSDFKVCEAQKQWYFLSKTKAEREALKFAKTSELNVITVCPSLVLGPLLQPTINSSSSFLLKLLRDGSESVDNRRYPIVDVRDTAEALLLVYEKAEAEGRYICSSHEITVQDLVEKLKEMFPHYNYPKSFVEVQMSVKLSSQKLQNLGWKFRSIEETIVDAVKCFEEKGHLVELIEPAVTGTLNVLNACLTAKLKKAVVVSSIGAIVFNPFWPKDQVMDEQSWSYFNFCETPKQWYCLSKTKAEREALEFAKTSELNVVTVCPSLILGQLLPPTINTSSSFLLKLLRDGESEVIGKYPIVDVRDTAEALLLVYEKAEAEGRYTCCSHEITAQYLAEKLKEMFPHYNYPKSFVEVQPSVKLSSQKLQNLGWKFRPIEETIVDAVKSFEEKGHLVKS